ncbi:hypothetical protein ACFSR9_15165 [Deinococcus taklimakanensis]|uniref:Uncharacterized protein n=1 Tax=Deinococcus taklimakanensis TaxID=536443 RepID=A0ABW5P8F3_9DEIO
MLKAAQSLKFEPHFLNYITKKYRQMLQAVARAHNLPEVTPPFTQTTQNNSKAKRPKSAKKRETPPAEVSPPLLNSHPLTPYQQKLAQQKLQREQRHLRDEQRYQQAIAIEMNREMRAAIADSRRRREMAERQKKLNAQRQREAEAQQQAKARIEAHKLDLKRSQLDRFRNARANAQRQTSIYRKIALSEITVPKRLDTLTPRRLVHWLPEHCELEFETELGTVFVPLAAQLSFDPGFCRCLLKAARGLTLEESLNILEHCLLQNRNFQSTPHAIELLEHLHQRLQASGKRRRDIRAKLVPLTPELRWRQKRCAEQFGYRAAELAEARAGRAEALIGKGQWTPRQHTLTTAAYRTHEWQGEMKGVTNFNPFEYK